MFICVVHYIYTSFFAETLYSIDEESIEVFDVLKALHDRKEEENQMYHNLLHGKHGAYCIGSCLLI